MQVKQRTLIIGMTVGFVVIIGIAIALFFVQQGKGKIITTSFPSDLILTLDGKPIPATDTTYIEPGKHTLDAKRDGFGEQKTDFTIKSGETQTQDFYLTSINGIGLAYLNAHPGEAAAIEGKQSELFDQRSNKIYNDNVIVQTLPVIDSTFRIDLGASLKGGDFGLYIQAADQAGRDDALDWMKTNRFDPTKYEIIYVDPATGVQTPSN